MSGDETVRMKFELPRPVWDMLVALPDDEQDRIIREMKIFLLKSIGTGDMK